MMKTSMKHLVSFYSLNLHQSRNISTKIPFEPIQSFTQKSHLVTSALPRPFIMDPPDNHSNHEPNEKPKVKNPISTILNTNLDGGNLDVLRREFSKTGKGSFELHKDETSGVATLTINNVERRNSFSGLMMAQFNEVLTQLEEWKEGKAVIIRGKDGFFCSGGDLSSVVDFATHEGGRQMGLLMQENLRRLEQLPLITVAVIEGKAIGGGAEICTATDFRLMTPSAEIGFVHVRIGITAGWGGGSRLVQLIGPSNALDMMASGRRLNADQALKVGLISDILTGCDESNSEDVITIAQKWLTPYVFASPEVVKAIKGIVVAAKTLPIEDALRKECEIFSSVWGGPAHKKAMTMNVKHK